MQSSRRYLFCSCSTLEWLLPPVLSSFPFRLLRQTETASIGSANINERTCPRCWRCRCHGPLPVGIGAFTNSYAMWW